MVSMRGLRHRELLAPAFRESNRNKFDDNEREVIARDRWYITEVHRQLEIAAASALLGP
jgi:hypothetical protein